MTTEGRADLAARLARVQSEIAALDKELAPKLERRRQLQRYARVTSCVLAGGVRPATYAEQLEAILARLARPASPAELLDALLAGGRAINGKTRGSQLTTVMVTLKRGPQFRRVGRGLYGLARWTTAA